MRSFSRREFIKAGMAVGATAVAFTSLGCRANSGLGYKSGNLSYSSAYGPLSPKQDTTTGLYLLALPDGFEYMSFGWTGQIMDDGGPTPAGHDGMAVVAKQGHRIALVRNHELSAGQSNPCLVSGGMYNVNEFGGTTNLVFDLKQGRFVNSYTSLGGTIRNCGGGPTPWGSWVSCEETFHPWGCCDDGFNHGYVFEVPGFGTSNGEPIRAAGRFSHEAVAIDPTTGFMYETEDAGMSGFYKYVESGAGSLNWRAGRAGRAASEGLRDSGVLYAMVVDGVSRKDMTNESGTIGQGDSFSVTWQKVTDPEAVRGRAFDSAPDAAIFSRGEGCWQDAGKIYFVSTDGGRCALGQVWLYDPGTETLTLLFEASDASAVDGPDNIAISPRGGLILCEDGGSNPKRLVGLTSNGDTFAFAQNLIELGPGDMDAIDAVFPGTKANLWDNWRRNFTGSEWAGATFHNDWLFANVQSPGVTFAIRGPWKKGSL